MLEMALESNVRKVQQQKLRLTQNWVHELKVPEEEISGKENQFQLSDDFVECSISNESTRSLACLPNFTAFVRDDSVHARKRSIHLSQLSCHLLTNDAVTTQNAADDMLVTIKESAVPVVQDSLLHLTDASNHLHLMESASHLHAREYSTPSPLFTKDSSLHFTEESTDLHPTENSTHLSETRCLHLIEESHLMKYSIDPHVNKCSGPGQVIEDSAPVHLSENVNHEHPNENQTNILLTKDLTINTALCINEESTLNFTQGSLVPLAEDCFSICNTGLLSESSVQLTSDMTFIYVIPDVTVSEAVADDKQLVGKDVVLQNKENSGTCDSRIESLHCKQVSLFKKANKKEGCKQVYDKVNYCTFCMKLISSKIARHLLNVHRDQAEVMKVLLLPKRSKERLNALSLLVNEGNFKHNSQVLKSGEGQIVVGCRNPIGSQLHNPSEYLPCEICKKFLLKSSLWIHTRKCTERLAVCNQSDANGQDFSQPYGYAVSKGRSLLNSALLNDDEIIMGELLQRMNDDKIKNVVIEDALIKRYSSLRMESLGSKDDQKLNDVHRVSQGARTLARLVLECRNIKPVKVLNELIEPENFDLIVAATKKMAFEGEKPAASLGRLIGNILGHVIAIKVGNALRRNDHKASEKAANFRRLFEAEWNYRVNSVGTKISSKAKRQKIATIPITEDLKTLRQFLLADMTDTATRLEMFKLKSDWTWLAKLTLSRLILFNKRRRAEVKDLKVDEYLGRPKWNDDENGEMQMALTKTDAVLAKRYELNLSLNI